MKYAPIAIFAFNRADTLRRVLDNLSRCVNLSGEGQRKGYAFVDGPRDAEDEPKIAEVIAVLEQFKKQKFPNLTIITREKNLGNPVNMPDGIATVLDLHGRVIIVEDDILVSKTFFSYMDSALEKYEADDRVWCINAWRSRYVKLPYHYKNDVYLNPRNMCWGRGTWKDRWSAVDLSMSDWSDFRRDQKNLDRLEKSGIDLFPMLESQSRGHLKSWDVQCSYHMAKNGLFAVEPRYALTKNIGFGMPSAHCTGVNTAISHAKYFDFNPQLVDFKTLHAQSGLTEDLFRYAYQDPRLISRLIRKVQRIWWGLGSLHNEPIVMSI